MPRNLRILKKLSKKAAPLLAVLGDSREQFPAEDGNACIGIILKDRKHFARGRSCHADLISQGEIKKPAADGRGWVWMRPPYGPREDTIMVGSMVGYYEPEWEEESAWEALHSLVVALCTKWPTDIDETPTLTRRLDSPSDILRAARELAASAAARKAAL